MSLKPNTRRAPAGLPPKQGLYDPQYEHDSCGVGFVVNIKGKKSHKIIRDALTILINLNHRGACGCEANTGDGAGILMQMPHGFFKEVCRKDKIKLPPLGDYGVAMVFLPRDANERRTCEKMFENIVVEEGPEVSGLARRCRPTTPPWARRPGRANRSCSRPSSAAIPSWTTNWPSSASSTSSANGPSGPSVTAASRAAIGFTFPAFPAARWSIRECS